MPFDNFEAIYISRHSVVVIQSVTVVVTIVVRSLVYLSNGKYTQSVQLNSVNTMLSWAFLVITLTNLKAKNR